MLPAEIIVTDHQLEEIRDKADGQLARHRWHWTLDDTNPNRVSVSEYARQAGRSESSIRVMVNGYATWLDDNTFATRREPASNLDDYIGRARMSGETAAAAGAVAKARGLTIRGVSDPGSKYQNEVRRVREEARQRAEENNTSIEEEAPKAAETIVAHERAVQEEQQEKAERLDFRVIEAERHALTAKRSVSRAIKALEQVELDDDAIEILRDALNGLKTACTLFDVRLSGKSGVDWDAELARLA